MEKIKFFDDNGKKVINFRILDEEAEKIAQSLFFVSGRNKNGVSSSQLRKFFYEIKSLEKKYDYEKNWDTVKPLVKMIKSKVAYANTEKKVGRFNKPYYDKFTEFINTGIYSIEDEKDLKAFSKMFEAVVGFYYGLGGDSVK
ncbi:MAG: type III-A CRISPR-associated protein Csm2 [Candidatus Delongbacteria bacterium]|nr:type III-A CRISPR-associated protein Csm2 [Candidatus Delongbacteria bacterium]MCG2760497.1 type III-A CRISPR-associated protein Csm2 [Candidatus Delongbacteria bacterium]